MARSTEHYPALVRAVALVCHAIWSHDRSQGWRRRVALSATAAARGATKRSTTMPLSNSFPNAPALQAA